MKNHEYESKHDQYFYNIQRNNSIKPIGLTLGWYNKTIPPLNVYYGKTPPYVRTVFLNHYNYRDDTELVKGVVTFRIITCGFHAYQIQLSITWYPKIKYGCNQPRHARVLNCKFFKITGSHNN